LLPPWSHDRLQGAMDSGGVVASWTHSACLPAQPSTTGEGGLFYSKGVAMNELLPFGEKKMTVREVSEALGYQPDTIQKIAKALEAEGGIARISIRPDSSHALLLDAEQVQAVKDSLVPRTLTLKSKVDSASTKLDMAQKAREVMAWLTSETERLQAELDAAAPKVALADAIGRSDRNMSITDACKHVGLHPKTEVFPIYGRWAT
jgi:DNA-binding Lrp family transcriptional regulator